MKGKALFLLANTYTMMLDVFSEINYPKENRKLLEKGNGSNAELKSQLDEVSKAKKDLEAKVNQLEQPLQTTAASSGSN